MKKKRQIEQKNETKSDSTSLIGGDFLGEKGNNQIQFNQNNLSNLINLNHLNKTNPNHNQNLPPQQNSLRLDSPPKQPIQPDLRNQPGLLSLKAQRGGVGNHNFFENAQKNAQKNDQKDPLDPNNLNHLTHLNNPQTFSLNQLNIGDFVDFSDEERNNLKKTRDYYHRPRCGTADSNNSSAFSGNSPQLSQNSTYSTNSNDNLYPIVRKNNGVNFGNNFDDNLLNFSLTDLNLGPRCRRRL